MRNIVNISLPKELNKEVEKAVKSGRYASKSEFFRDLIRLWQEQKLLDEIMESEKEFAEGKGKVLRSLKDLR
ncbi:MAG: ribbon-helix-helix domain-containing protein [Patescibacteria group bacterium]|mgnify:CR=1 FL=1